MVVALRTERIAWYERDLLLLQKVLREIERTHAEPLDGRESVERALRHVAFHPQLVERGHDEIAATVVLAFHRLDIRSAVAHRLA